MTDNATNRPTVLYHVDLDSLWAIRRVYDLPGGDFRAPDPVYDLAVRRFLDLFESRGVRATFFAIGNDCQVESRAKILAEAVARGHEVANHSNTHPIEIGALSLDRVHDEIFGAQEAIHRATGTLPVGFRAPGYDLSPTVLRVAMEAGLAYDASLLPTRAGGILRTVSGLFRRGGRKSGTEGQYGRPEVAHAPTSPYFASPENPWKPCAEVPSANLFEIPVAVTPRWRLPVHGSIAIAAGWFWTRHALDAVCTGFPVVVYAFHGLDLVGGEETEGLPGGVLGRKIFLASYEKKRRIVRNILEFLSERGEVALTRDFAAKHSLKAS